LYKAIANTAGVRASRGFEAGTLGTKVRNARLLKVPFMTVIGAKEEDAGALSARTRDRKQNRSVKPADFVQVRDMVSVLSDGYIRALGPAG
jgi:threonyl-tRNA synthetase